MEKIDVVKNVITASSHLDSIGAIKSSEELVKCAEKLVNDDVTAIENFDKAIEILENERNSYAWTLKDSRDLVKTSGIMSGVGAFMRGKLAQYGGELKKDFNAMNEKFNSSGKFQDVLNSLNTIVQKYSQIKMDQHEDPNGILQKYVASLQNLQKGLETHKTEYENLQQTALSKLNEAKQLVSNTNNIFSNMQQAQPSQAPQAQQPPTAQQTQTAQPAQQTQPTAQPTQSGMTLNPTQQAFLNNPNANPQIVNGIKAFLGLK